MPSSFAILSLLPQPAAPRLALNIPASLIDVPDKCYEETLHNDGSPLSFPPSAADSDPINFSQPMSASHNQIRYPSNRRNPPRNTIPLPATAVYAPPFKYESSCLRTVLRRAAYADNTSYLGIYNLRSHLPQTGKQPVSQYSSFRLRKYRA